MSSSASAAQPRFKSCRVCGRDLSSSRRIRDAEGNYYCNTCYEELSNRNGDGPAGNDAPLATCSACGAQSPTGEMTREGVAVLCKPCAAAQRAARPAASTASPQRSTASTELHGLLPRITCPHCWHIFPPEKTLFVAQHAELLGDPILGPETHARFLPTRFSVEGHALDARGMACQQLACPHCHLTIPRSLLETEPLFVSIIGVPASGKSYFLTSMAWELRRLLPSSFGVSFSDVDTLSNHVLNEYEERLFLQPDANKLVALDKTEEQGHLYDQIRLGQQIISLPRPFLFRMNPIAPHPAASSPVSFARVVCLYDNAGESFLPGHDTTASPVTRHLAKSRVLMFLFDPTQDARFRERCKQVSDDPQLALSARSQRQETVLHEAAARVRKYLNLPSSRKHDRPLIVIVPKLDAWEPLLGQPISAEPFAQKAVANALAAVDISTVEATSARVRQLLATLTPEFVTAAEEFCQHVIYVPVSSLGRGPELEAETGRLAVRPKDIRPRWVTVPFLYMFAKWSTGLIGGVQRSATHAPAASSAG